jgi:hypothetical protein
VHARALVAGRDVVGGAVVVGGRVVLGGALVGGRVVVGGALVDVTGVRLAGTDRRAAYQVAAILS